MTTQQKIKHAVDQLQKSERGREALLALSKLNAGGAVLLDMQNKIAVARLVAHILDGDVTTDDLAA